MLTVEQRIQAYEYAMTRIWTTTVRPWICISLNDWLSNNQINVNRRDAGFTEFELFTPGRMPFRGSTRYFNDTRHGNKTREIILLFCIEIAKDEITEIKNWLKAQPLSVNVGQ